MLPNAGGLVYGTIIVATLLATESARSETYPRTVAAVILALLAYWLTVAYAHDAGDRLEHQSRFGYRAFARAAIQELTLLYGSVIPLVVVLICWAAGVSLADAIRVAVWAAAVAIVAAELLTGIRADLRGKDLVRQTTVGACIGLLIIALRLVLHH